MREQSYSTQNSDTLDLSLSQKDMAIISELDQLYNETSTLFPQYSDNQDGQVAEKIIDHYAIMGKKMRDFLSREPRITVYSFATPRNDHGEASRVVSKLRAYSTPHAEFIYYTQKAYEMMFKLIYHLPETSMKSYSFLRTPISKPFQHFAVHNIPDIGDTLSNTVMCVMLRGALLPSMIISKEIQEYSPAGYVTPFMLFDIKRISANRKNKSIVHRLDLSHSYFDLSALDDKDLIFADPVNATTGSLYTIVKYLQQQGIKPRRIIFMNIISSFSGSLRAVRNIDNAHCYVLWMDPTLDERAYVVPGLGDAGDRLNRPDPPGVKRNIVELIAGYDSSVTYLYRSQIRAIEAAVLR